MKGTLLIFTLSIASSYLRNIESVANDHFDVIEFWISDSQTYRIKTFALDADIHIYKLDYKGNLNSIALATENTNKNYGDILAKSYRIDFNGLETESEIKNKLDSLKITGTIEKSEFMFWNPDRQFYKTQSFPQK